MGFGLRRLAVCLPPLILTVLGIAMLAVAPAAWGKGDQVDLPGWMPTVSAVLFGVPALAIGLLFLREILLRTREDFAVSLLQMAGAMLAIAVAMALEFVLITRVASSGTYESLMNSDGTINTTPSAFMVWTVVGVLIMSLLVGMAAYIYRQAVTPISHRFDRGPGERDVMGEMLHHQPSG